MWRRKKKKTTQKNRYIFIIAQVIDTAVKSTWGIRGHRIDDACVLSSILCVFTSPCAISLLLPLSHCNKWIILCWHELLSWSVKFNLTVTHWETAVSVWSLEWRVNCLHVFSLTPVTRFASSSVRAVNATSESQWITCPLTLTHCGERESEWRWPFVIELSPRVERKVHNCEHTRDTSEWPDESVTHCLHP